MAAEARKKMPMRAKTRPIFVSGSIPECVAGKEVGKGVG